MGRMRAGMHSLVREKVFLAAGPGNIEHSLSKQKIKRAVVHGESAVPARRVYT